MGVRRLVSLFAGGLCALCAALFCSAPALAGVTHKPPGSFSPPPGSAPQSLTVDPPSGDVYVVDAETGRVERFDAAGNPAPLSALGTNVLDGAGGGECPTVPSDCDQTPQGGFAFFSPSAAQVAVDSSGGPDNGDIYVTNTFNGVVDIFAADGRYLGQISERGSGGERTPLGWTCGVAVDRFGGVYVAEFGGSVYRYQSFSNPASNADFLSTLPISACQLAVNGEGDLFANQWSGPVSKYDSTGMLQYALDSNTASGVSVDPFSGDVYVAESSSVVQFDASSSIAPVVLGSFGAGSVSSPAGVAVNGAGEAYVSDAATGDVDIFGPGVPAPDANSGGASAITDTKATVEGGVNPDGTATEWQFQYGTETSYGQTAPASPQSAGNGSSEVPVSTELSGLSAGTTYHYRLIAIGENGTTYGADQTFTTQAPPSVDSESAGSITKTTATLSAQINPFGAETTYHFEYGPSESYGSGTSDATIAAGWGDQPAGAEITGLTPGASYHYRVVASNSLGGPVDGPDQTFTAEAVAGVSSVYADKVGSGEATLHAEVNPLGDATTYRFEYGPTEAYGTSVPVPDGSVGEGSESVSVSQTISGLPAETVVHFRVVATNAQGTVTTEDHTFSTFPVSVETSCANAKIREEQHSTYLPDCRAFEKVSPEDKGGGDIVGDGETNIASTSGDAVTLSSRTPFGDEVGSGTIGQIQYVARRDGGAGWSTHAVTPTPQPEAFQTFLSKTYVEIFSDDLSTAVVWGYDLPGGGGTPKRMNIYTEDTSMRALQPLTLSQAEPLEWTDFIEVRDSGISADAKHVAFVGESQLLPNAIPGVSNLYQSDDGVLSLADILPDGTVSPSGAYLGSQTRDYRGAMSSDGSRLVFTTLSKNPQLYMRIEGERTAWISEPENGENTELTEVESSESAQVHLQAVTPNGRNVFFITNSKLLTADTNEGPDLYRWSEGPDPAHEENLTLITNSGNMGETTGGVVPGVSDDGTKVYYQTTGDELFVWDNGTPRLISFGVTTDGAINFSLAATAWEPGAGRVTPDGNWMAFLTVSTAGNDRVHALTGQVIDAPGESKYEMYLYSLKSDRLICVSCGASLPAASVSVTPRVTGGEPTIFDAGVRPRFLSDDGRVFFSTPDALVAQDTNGVIDTYEYDPHTGNMSLLSSGVGSDPSMFTEASPSGNDVFIVTRQRLVAEDHDSLVDLYDLRSDGGFPSPPAPQGSCVADECQPQPSPPPAFGPPVTAGFTGPGNVSGHIARPVVRKSQGARKLARALRACRRKHGKARRRRCEAKARKRYGKRNAGRAK